jgi:putative transposase
VRYVERNPVRAGLAERAEDYPWSSAAAHCGKPPPGAATGLLSEDFPPPGLVQDWSAWLAEPEDEARVHHLRAHTRTGRPCGTPSFLDQLENLTQRALRPKKRGRKPKAMQNE